MSQETWRPVPGFPTYEVSDQGNLRRVVPLKFQLNRKGYPQCAIYRKKRKTTIAVHRLVAMAFLPEPEEGKDQVNHIDGTKTNNSPENLEWVTNHQNALHAQANGLFVQRKGEAHGMAKITREQADAIRKECRAKGATHRQIAERYGISAALVAGISCGRLWREEEAA